MFHKTFCPTCGKSGSFAKTHRKPDSCGEPPFGGFWFTSETNSDKIAAAISFRENGMKKETFAADRIRAYLGQTNTVGCRIDCFASIDSTNAYLKRIASGGAPDGTAAVAAEQTAGRGRRGRVFQSAANQGVYLSVLLRPGLAADALMPLTGACAAAMCDAVERVCGVRPQVKWTNDLVLNGKKLGGILTELGMENGTIAYVIVGIGINVSQQKEDFRGEVADLATSLEQELGREVSKNDLAAAMIAALDALYADLRCGDTAKYVERYRRDCVTIGKDVQLLWQDVREKVFALDVDEQFGLVVRRENGKTETIRTGEVSVRGLYGYVN